MTLEISKMSCGNLFFLDHQKRVSGSSDQEEENASSFKDGAGGLKKSPLSQVITVAAGEGLCPSPERYSVLRHTTIPPKKDP